MVDELNREMGGVAKETGDYGQGFDYSEEAKNREKKLQYVVDFPHAKKLRLNPLTGLPREPA